MDDDEEEEDLLHDSKLRKESQRVTINDLYLVALELRTFAVIVNRGISSSLF